MVKTMEKEKYMLYNQLRDLEWRLDQESKVCYMHGSRGGGGRGPGPQPLKSHKAMGFLSNTCQTSKPTFNVRPSMAPNERTFKWRFAGRRMVACLLWYLDLLSPDHLKTKTKQKTSELDPL